MRLATPCLSSSSISLLFYSLFSIFVYLQPYIFYSMSSGNSSQNFFMDMQREAMNMSDDENNRQQYFQQQYFPVKKQKVQQNQVQQSKDMLGQKEKVVSEKYRKNLDKFLKDEQERKQILYLENSQYVSENKHPKLENPQYVDENKSMYLANSQFVNENKYMCLENPQSVDENDFVNSNVYVNNNFNNNYKLIVLLTFT